MEYDLKEKIVSIFMFTHIESEREEERKIKNEKKIERDRGNKKDRKK